jgi:hypothetical protein
MTRVLILVLLLANLGYYAWTKGWLDPVAGAPAMGDREPERLARQVSPDLIRLLPPDLSASGNERAMCLEIGPFVPAQVPAAEMALQSVLPAGSWSATGTEVPAVWTVYMGRFTTREAVTRKIEELDRLKVPFLEVTSPPDLAPGVSLGRFEDRAAAEKALAEFTQRGVRTARVVELSPRGSAVMLRVARADLSAQGKLVALRDAALQGRSFASCTTEPLIDGAAR